MTFIPILNECKTWTLLQTKLLSFFCFFFCSPTHHGDDLEVFQVRSLCGQNLFGNEVGLVGGISLEEERGLHCKKTISKTNPKEGSAKSKSNSPTTTCFPLIETWGIQCLAKVLMQKGELKLFDFHVKYRTHHPQGETRYWQSHAEGRQGDTIRKPVLCNNPKHTAIATME